MKYCTKQAAIDMEAIPFQQKRRFKILICGYSGCGKSLVINCLVGDKLFDVDSARDSDEYETAHLKQTFKVLNGHELMICESSALEEGAGDEAHYRHSLLTEYSDADLVLYCVELKTSRWQPQQTRALKLLTTLLGPEMWNKAVIVLTKANELWPSSAATDPKEYFTSTFDRLQKNIKQKLLDARVPVDIVDKLPVVASGRQANEQLLNGQFVMSVLWMSCLDRLSNHPETQQVFIAITNAKVRYRATDEFALSALEESYQEELEGYIMIPDPTTVFIPSHLKKVAAVGSGAVAGTILGSIIGGVAGGVIGAAVGGAAIGGTLAILPQSMSRNI